MIRIFYFFALLLISTSCFSQQSEKVALLCNWNDTAGLSNHNGQYFSDVWGFTWKGKEYAAIGSCNGVHIIDVNNCQQVAYHKSTSSGTHVIHRDYKTYKNYLYAVCDEGFSARLEIFDLSYLPDSLHRVYVSSSLEVMTTHNIFIDTTNAKLYLGIHGYLDTTGTGGYVQKMSSMSVYSLADPKKPVRLTRFSYPKAIHDMYVHNDTAYCSAETEGLVVVSFARDTAYDILGILPDYDYKGYNHSSWINSKGIGIMADETHGSPMKVIDTRNTNNIEVIGYFMPSPDDTNCIPHNPYILNEDYVLISYYYDGLQIYNFSRPDSPYRVGYYDTYPGQSYKSYAGAWGCYPYLPSHRILVSDMQTGLYVFNADTALNLHIKKDSLLTSKSFAIYPNPASDKINILLQGETGDIGIVVCDVTGRVIVKESIYISTAANQSIELPLPQNCAVGMYTIHIRSRDQSFTGKFIKAP